MIRFPQLFKEYGNLIGSKVTLDEDPLADDSEDSLNKILSVLYKSNNRIHSLQKELSVHKEYEIQELEKANSVIAPAEEAAEKMLRIITSLHDYMIIAAKVTDAGDKLDNVVLNEAAKAEKRFRTEYSRVEKWKKGYGSEEIADARSKLKGHLDRFSSLEGLIAERRLPEKAVRSAKAVFSEYRKKLELMEEVNRDINNIFARYQEISLIDHLKDFAKECRKQFRKSTFFSKTLLDKCLKADYKEGIEALQEIEADMRYVIKNFSKRDNIQEVVKQIQAAKEKAERYKETLDSINEADLSPNDISKIVAVWEFAANNKFSKFQNCRYLSNLLSGYREVSDRLQEKAEMLMKEEAKRLGQRYKEVEEKSRQIPGSFYEINAFFLTVDKAREELKDIKLRFNALSYGPNKYNAGKLAEINERMVEEMRNVKNAYDKVQRIKRKASKLKEDLDNYGADEKMIGELSTLDAEARSTRPNIRYQGLREEFNSEAEELRKTLDSSVQSCLAAVDKRYEEAEKNPSYDLSEIFGLYQKIGQAFGVNMDARFSRLYALSRQREKTDRENKLKSQLAELTREKAELEEQNQLTELQSNQYAAKIEDLAKQLKESEAEKTAYQAEKERLEEQLKQRLADLTREKTELEGKSQLTESQSQQYTEKIEELTRQLEASETKTAGYEAVITELRNQGVNEKEINPEAQEADGYRLQELLKTFGEPDNPDLKILGDTLLGTYHNCRWISRIDHITDEVKSMQDCGIALDSADVRYLTGVSECIKASMHNGHLGDATKGFSGHRKKVYDTVKLIDGFLQQSAGVP